MNNSAQYLENEIPSNNCCDFETEETCCKIASATSAFGFLGSCLSMVSIHNPLLTLFLCGTGLVSSSVAFVLCQDLTEQSHVMNLSFLRRYAELNDHVHQKEQSPSDPETLLNTPISNTQANVVKANLRSRTSVQCPHY